MVGNIHSGSIDQARNPEVILILPLSHALIPTESQSVSKIHLYPAISSAHPTITFGLDYRNRLPTGFPASTLAVLTPIFP